MSNTEFPKMLRGLNEAEDLEDSSRGQRNYQQDSRKISFQRRGAYDTLGNSYIGKRENVEVLYKIEHKFSCFWAQ